MTKRHPAIVGDSTGAIIATIRDCRHTGDAIQASFLAEHLLFAYDECDTADFIEALTWLKKAADGDAEAKAVVAACPSWRDEDREGWYEAVSAHDADLRERLRMPPKTKRTKAATAAQDGQDELQRVEEHSDRLPKAWRPSVKPGSATALAWEALCALYGKSKAPVPDETWKRVFLTDYLPATAADPAGAMRDARRNLKEQKAIRESAEGWTPRLTA